MNIKDFLIDNYIWMIVIILIAIITIIGFLADKKSRGKKEKKANNQLEDVNNQQVNNQMMTNQQPIQYQQPIQFQNNQPNNNLGLNFNNMNTTVKPLNQMNNVSLQTTQPTIAEQMSINPINNQVDLMNNINPINNVIPNNIAEPMYQPLSEQKPNFSPQPIPNISNMQQPVNIEQNQILPMVNNLEENNTQTFNAIPSVSPTIQTQPVQMPPEQSLNPIYNVNSQVQQIENSETVPNFIPNNTTIPTPVNHQPIPVPKQVIPQPITQNNYNQLQPMQQNLGVQPNQQLQQPIQQQGQTMTQQPINFVYGSQNTNQNI